MTQPELTRLLHEVGAVPAPAADYGATVRATVARGRVVRTAVLGVAAVALVGGLAAGALALTGGGDDTVAVAPTPTPTVEPSPEPTPTPKPTASPTPSPTPEPVVTTAAPVVTTQPPRTTAPRTSSPTPRRTTASPAPRPYAAKGLSVTLSAPRTVSDGSGVTFSVSVRDNDGKLLSATIDFGDGTSERLPLGSTCGARSGTDPEPLSYSTTRSHTYLGPGSYTAVLRVQTGSSCRSTPKESKSDSQTVDVV